MGRALFPGAGFLEAAIAGTVHALPVDVATSADVVLRVFGPRAHGAPDPSSLPDVSSSGTKEKIGGEIDETRDGRRSGVARGTRFRDGGDRVSRRLRRVANARASRARVAMLSKGRERTGIRARRTRDRLRRTRSSAAAANERRRDRSEPSPRASTTSTSGTSSTPRAWITPCSSAPLAFAPKTTPEGTVSKPKVMVPAAVDAFVSPDRASSARVCRVDGDGESHRELANVEPSSHAARRGRILAAVRGLVVKEMRQSGADRLDPFQTDAGRFGR